MVAPRILDLGGRNKRIKGFWLSGLHREFKDGLDPYHSETLTQKNQEQTIKGINKLKNLII